MSFLRSQVASFLDPVQVWNGTAPFYEEMRHQLGYRVEQYGSKAIIFRFIHPSSMVVPIFNGGGDYIGAGITSYNSEDIQRIRGKHTSLIAEILSYDYGNAVISKDKMSLATPK
jgi:hypothetical protein